MQTVSNQKRYVARSFKMLTQMGPVWILHVLVLSLLQIIPIFGQMCLLGYAFLWSNRTAWGMETAPDQGGIDAGKIIKHGAKMFVPYAVWNIALAIVLQIVGLFAMIPVIGWIIYLLSMVLSFFVTVLIYVATQRASLYEMIVPGFQLDKIYDMCQRDWKGLLRICGFYTLMSVIMTVVCSLIVLPPLFTGLVAAFGSSSAGAQITEAEAFTILLSVAASMIGVVCFAAFIGALFMVFMFLMTANMVGIWTSQFYPETWGPYTEPIPRQPKQMVYMAQQMSYAQPVEQPAQTVQQAPTPAPAEQPVSDVQPVETTPADVTVSEDKSGEVKPVEGKPAETHRAEDTTPEAKPAETKPAEVKPAQTTEQSKQPSQDQPTETEKPHTDGDSTPEK